MRLDYAIEGYWLARKRDLSPATVDDYGRTFDRLCAHLGPEIQLEAITSAEINHFLNQLQEAHGLGDKTLANIWTALSSLWTWAQQELGAPHIIRNGVRQPRATRQPVVPFTEEEVKHMIDACRYTSDWTTRTGRPARTRRSTALRDEAILLVFLDTGIRVSELTALTLGDYDQRRGQLVIRHGKGDKMRMVYLGQRARKALWKYLASRQDACPTDPLLAASTGNGLDRNAVYHMIQRCGDRAGVSGAHPHRFRHTFAVSFLRNGGSSIVLQRLLGHEHMETVRLYINLAAVDLEKAHGAASPADNWRL